MVFARTNIKENFSDEPLSTSYMQGRETIFLKRAQGAPLRTIGQVLHSNPATISRELTRHFQVGDYSLARAQAQYRHHKAQCGRKHRSKIVCPQLSL